LFDYMFDKVRLPVAWFRMLIVFFLLKTKQTNDAVLDKMQEKPFLSVLPQRLLILIGALLEYVMGRIRPDDRTMAELKKMPKQQQHFVSRQTYKPDAFITTRQNIVVTKQETHVSRNNIASNPSQDSINQTQQNPDIARFHAQLKPTDYELLYSKLPVDTIPNVVEHDGPLTADQQMLYAKLIGNDLKRQGYEEDDDANIDDDNDDDEEEKKDQ